MKTVIFDFDGTIADTLTLTIASFNAVAKDFSLSEIQPGDVEILRDLSARELLKKFPLPPWKLLRLVTSIQRAVHSKMTTVPLILGMDDVLNRLRKTHAIGIVTSNSVENVQTFLHTHDLTVDFIHSEKNIFGKAQILRKICRERKIPLESVTYVGDEVRDIEAAQGAGMKSIAVTWGFNSKRRLEQANPTAIVDTPESLLYYLS